MIPPMRIGIDARLHAYRPGGISTYARELSRALLELGHEEQEYIVLQHWREARSWVSAANRVRLLTPPHHPWEAWALGLELASKRLHLLHSTDFIPPQMGARRFVITIHDVAFIKYPEFLTAAARRHYQGKIHAAIQKADHILAVSAATKDDIIQWLAVAPERITVQHHGFREEFRPHTAAEIQQARERWKLPADYFLFVGTMEPRKNLSALLRGYRMLRAQQAEAPALLLCAPEGWCSERIHQEVADAPGVIWWKEVPSVALPALYAAARALVLPSHDEGFGLPALEAMASGTSTILSDIPALREVAGELGWWIQPDEPQTIAAALSAALEQGAPQEQERAAAIQRSRRFSWQRSAQIAQKVYSSLR